MNRAFLIAVLCFVFGISFFNVASARTNYGGKIAAAVTNVTSESQDESIGPILGFQVGGIITESVNSWFQLQVEALYSAKGAETEDGDFTLRLNYLEIPILAKFKLASIGDVGDRRVNFNVGLYNAFNLSNSVTLLGQKFDTDEIASHDIGLISGFDLMLTNKLGLDFRYSFGLSKLTKTGDKMTNIGMLLALSYYFN